MIYRSANSKQQKPGEISEKKRWSDIFLSEPVILRKKRIIAIFMCLAMLSSAFIFSVEAIDVTWQSSPSVGIVEKNFNTNMVTEKVYSQNADGSTDIELLDTWADTEISVNSASAFSLIKTPTASLFGII